MMKITWKLNVEDGRATPLAGALGFLQGERIYYEGLLCDRKINSTLVKPFIFGAAC